MAEIQLINGGTALVDDDDLNLVSRFRWSRATGGYIKTSIAKSVNLSMHRLIMVPDRGKVVDHINGNPSDNRKCNLRVCTPHQNSMNRRGQSAKSGFKGVYASRSRWMAILTVDGNQIYLGTFEKAEEAACAYDTAARKHFGEFAHCNTAEEPLEGPSARLAAHENRPAVEARSLGEPPAHQP
jgi:hypothetical protein